MNNNSVLFNPIATENLSIANRIVMAPMTRGQSLNNIPNSEVARYYRKRAEGGAGLIITECTFIDHPVANSFPNAPAFHGEEALSAWADVVKEVHAEGGKIVPQIWHAGAARAVGTSPNPYIPSIGPVDILENGKQTVVAMSHNEIDSVIEAFAKAALNAKKLGFDGVEIHGAHSYLIDQFLWQKSNQRNDRYGGTLENRVRFASEIVRAVRDLVGEGFPIIFRFSQWKLTDYDGKIAHTAHELEKLLLPLVDAGVDIFHVSTRRFWEAAFASSDLSLAGWTKKITGKPVIAVGGVGIDQPFSLDIFSQNIRLQTTSTDLLESMMEKGEFDLIAVGRAILADAHWPNKIKRNALDSIEPFSSASLATLD